MHCCRRTFVFLDRPVIIHQSTKFLHYFCLCLSHIFTGSWVVYNEHPARLYLSDKKMLVLLFIVAKLSYGNYIRFWKNFGVLAEKTKEKIPVDTVETIKTLYEYPVNSGNKIQIMERMVGTLVDDGFGKKFFCRFIIY